MSGMTINEKEFPLTRASIARELELLGVKRGMTLLVHSSLKSFNRWIVGAPEAVVLALEDAIGDEGTLVMPAHSSDLSDPALWSNPPVPEAWWQTIREEMPAFSTDLTVTRGMGLLAESFRRQNGTLRSNHPQVSFAARGPKAAYITEHHSLEYGLGEGSPLARLYDCGAYVLLLGTGHENNTSLHLSEYRSDYLSKHDVMAGAPIEIEGERRWVTFKEINLNSDDFGVLGEAFDEELGDVFVKTRPIGDAVVKLMPQRELVDYGVQWLAHYRR